MFLKNSPNGKRPPIWLQVFIVAITLTAIAAAVFLSSQTYRETEKLAAEQFNQQQLILARSAATSIEAYFEGPTSELSSLVNLPEVQQMTPECLKLMQHAYLGFPRRTSIQLLDSKGILQLIYPFDGWRGELIGRDYSQEAFFQKARETGHVSVSKLIINEQGEMRIRIAVPIYLTHKTKTVRIGDKTGIIVTPINPSKPKSGRFQGVLVGSLDPYIIAQDLISPVVLGKTGYAWVLNEEGIFIAHHEEGFTGQNAFEVRAERNPGISYETIEQIQRKMMAGEEGIGRYVSGWHRGVKGEIEKLVAYTPVHINGHIWSVAVCAPVCEVEEIIHMAHRSELYTLGFVTLVLMTGALGLFIISYRWSHTLGREVARRTKELRESIDEQVRREKRIEHLNGVLKAIRTVNQLIVVEKDRASLFQKACDALIEVRGYEAAWLGFLKDKESFATVVGSGFLENLSRFCERVMDGDYPPCIRNALVQKEIVVVVDKFRECGGCFFKDACVGKEAAIIRVEHADRLFGLLTISLAANVAVDEEEKDLLKEVAGDIALALHNMELEEVRKRAEEALQESEEKYRVTFESTGTAAVIIEEDTTISLANTEFTKLCGYSKEEVEGKKSWTEFVVKDDLERMKEYHRLRRTAEDAAPGNYEFRFIDRHGEVKDIFLTIAMIPGTKKSVSSLLDITERKRAENQIKASLKEKEVLLQEIHHRVKNNLQVVSSLLNMQARTVKDKDTIEVLSESQNRINAMALIHAQLYESSNLSEINMKEFVDGLLRQLFQSYPVQDTKITPIVHVADHPLPISMAVPVGLIINELLTNILKYAFVNREKGKIEVILSASEKGEISLTVSDDGVGLPQGFDINATETLGLHLVKILVEDQLQGNLGIISKEGTTFKIEFEIENGSSRISASKNKFKVPKMN